MPSQTTTYNSSKSRFYLSGGFESTGGIAATLNKSFYPKAGGANIKLKKNHSYNDTVTGFAAPADRHTTLLSAEGSLNCLLSTDFAAMLFKYMTSAAPTSSAQVAPSTTVYEHTFHILGGAAPNLFTAMLQAATITNYTQTFCGLQLSSVSFKGGSGDIEASASVIGYGKLTRGTAEPVVSVTADGRRYLQGVNSNLYIDDVALTAGLLKRDWSIDLDTGLGIDDTAGSSDGTCTSIDIQKNLDFSADITRKEVNRTYLDEFVSETGHTWEFRMLGKTIDVPNSLQELVAIKFYGGTIVDEYDVGMENGVQYVRNKLRFDVDEATGRYATCRVRNLITSYA